jgi:hypothetical protein
MKIEFCDRPSPKAKRVRTACSAAAFSLAVSIVLGACSSGPDASDELGPGGRRDGMINQDIDSVFQNRTDVQSLTQPGGLDNPFSRGQGSRGLQ